MQPFVRQFFTHMLPLWALNVYIYSCHQGVLLVQFYLKLLTFESPPLMDLSAYECDKAFDQIIEEEMMDNTEEVVMRLILESQRCRPIKRAIDWSHEEEYDRAFSVLQKILKTKKSYPRNFGWVEGGKGHDRAKRDYHEEQIRNDWEPTQRSWNMV